MRWLLLPFSLLYGFVVNTRNRFYDLKIFKSVYFDFPVISIGNITVGGTGKTPHTEYLVHWLSKHLKVATLSRGYKRKTKGFREVMVDSTVAQSGDEPLQIKRKFPNVEVVVDEKRVHGIEQLLESEDKPELIILDDAYQHRKVTPGLSILLVDYNRPLHKDFLLPAGNLREPAHNQKRANVILVTKCPNNLNPIDYRLIYKSLNIFPYQHLFFTSFKYGELQAVFDAKVDLEKSLNNVDVMALSGIANPEPFHKALSKMGANVQPLKFPDHHAFTKTDLEKIERKFRGLYSDKKIIVCTEKDAIRLKEAAADSEWSKLPVFYLPIEVDFLNDSEGEFKSIVRKYLKRYIEDKEF